MWFWAFGAWLHVAFVINGKIVWISKFPNLEIKNPTIRRPKAQLSEIICQNFWWSFVHLSIVIFHFRNHLFIFSYHFWIFDINIDIFFCSCYWHSQSVPLSGCYFYALKLFSIVCVCVFTISVSETLPFIVIIIVIEKTTACATRFSFSFPKQ